MNKLRISLCTIGLRDRRPPEMFAAMKKMGIHYADVLAYGKQAHLSRAMSKPERAEVYRLAKASAVQICSFAGDVGDNFTSDDPAARKVELLQVKAEIDLAVEAGASVIRVSAGTSEDLDIVRARALPSLRSAVAYAASKNVKMGIENHSGGLGGYPEKLTELCREVSSPYFGVIYDPGNLFGDKVDYKQAFELFGSYVVHVHLKDGYPHYFGKDGFDPQRIYCTLFGKGQVDMRWIMDSLQRVAYDGFVSIEYEGWHPEYHLPPIDEGAKLAREYLETLTH